MATASLAGKDGNLSGVGNAEVKEWSCDITCDALDVTSFASGGWREFIEGLRGATGSFSAVGNVLPTAGSIALLTLQTGDSGAPQISGPVILTKVSAGVKVDGAVEFSADFTFKGQPTVGSVSGVRPAAGVAAETPAASRRRAAEAVSKE